MTSEEFMRDDKLTLRACTQVGLSFDEMWHHVHIRFYPVPEEAGSTRDDLLADPTPWNLRMTPEGVLPLRALIDPANRSLLTAWALLRWLVTDNPTGAIAARARAEVDRESQRPWTIAGAVQAHENKQRARRPRKKLDDPSHLDCIKSIMRSYKSRGMELDVFLRMAEERGGKGVHGLTVIYDRDDDGYQVAADDCLKPPPAKRSYAAIKRWYSESDKATSRT